MSSERETGAERKPFRAVDVLSGSIDRRNGRGVAKTRKQISAQLEPEQVRLLGELHARLNASAQARIEKSELVGLGIELLAAVLRPGADFDSAPDAVSSRQLPVARNGQEWRTVDELRAYVRTNVRAYAESAEPGVRADSARERPGR